MMHVVRAFVLFAVMLGCSWQSHAARSILGTWCIDDEGLVIAFRTKDSLVVKSTTDETVNGGGAYSLADSTFSATVVNGEIIIKLGYSYQWKNDSLITARPRFFIVNEDTAKDVTKWMTMRRCNGSATQGPAVPSAAPAEKARPAGKRRPK